MKYIYFFLDNGSEITIIEESKKEIKDYVLELSSLFSSNNVCNIEFKNSSILVRPSNICAIKIEDSENEETPDITFEGER